MHILYNNNNTIYILHTYISYTKLSYHCLVLQCIKRTQVTLQPNHLKVVAVLQNNIVPWFRCHEWRWQWHNGKMVVFFWSSVNQSWVFLDEIAGSVWLLGHDLIKISWNEKRPPHVTANGLHHCTLFNQFLLAKDAFRAMFKKGVGFSCIHLQSRWLNFPLFIYAISVLPKDQLKAQMDTAPQAPTQVPGIEFMGYLPYQSMSTHWLDIFFLFIKEWIRIVNHFGDLFWICLLGIGYF